MYQVSVGVESSLPQAAKPASTTAAAATLTVLLPTWPPWSRLPLQVTAASSKRQGVCRTYDIECPRSRTYPLLVFDTPETLARHDGVDGEVVVRRRSTPAGPVYELIVNGTFLMDTAETSTERLLAGELLDRHPDPATVLVAGLGFGCTVASLLADARVRRVDVVEIEPTLVDLLRQGVVPG